MIQFLGWCSLCKMWRLWILVSCGTHLDLGGHLLWLAVVVVVEGKGDMCFGTYLNSASIFIVVNFVFITVFYKAAEMFYLSYHSMFGWDGLESASLQHIFLPRPPFSLTMLIVPATGFSLYE